MKYLGLLKLLYIADRVALQRMEQSITGTQYVLMDYAPVLSIVYDLIKGKQVDQALPLWSKYVSSRDSNHASLPDNPGNEELCEAEEEILKQVYKDFGQLNPFDVVKWTHNLPEWENPNGSAIPILVENVLRYMGKTNAEIEEIRQEVVREAYLDEALNG